MTKTQTEKTTKIHPIATVTPTQLVGELLKMDGTGTSFEGMDCKVLVKMNKTAKRDGVKFENPYLNKVHKFYSLNVTSNAHYEAAVRRQQAREGQEVDFLAKPRKWGERIKKSPVVRHNGNFYFSTHVNTLTTDVVYKNIDGKIIDKANIEEFLPAKSASRQGLENEVIVRDYKIESIVQMRMKGCTYIVKHD